MNSTDDLVYQQLHQQLQSHQGCGLWVLDENLARVAPRGHQQDLELLTNRFDVYQQMVEAGWQTQYSDFDLTPWYGKGLDRIYYRVSKEKPVVHHIINQALRCLGDEGELILVGAKKEGTKTYIDKARELFVDSQLIKAGKGVFVGILSGPERATELCELLDDRDYSHLRQIASIGDPELTSLELPVLSKPGVFGWDKIDLGSQFLAANLVDVFQRLGKSSPRVIDLGCGYGYLSLRLWQQGAAEIYATDNNAAAIVACTENFRRHQINGRVIAANAGEQIAGGFDLVICNPPFHQGFSVEGELTDRFIGATKRLLASNGQAAFVVNKFIPLEKKALGLFEEIETFADNGSFKLVRLAKPARS